MRTSQNLSPGTNKEHNEDTDYEDLSDADSDYDSDCYGDDGGDGDY